MNKVKVMSIYISTIRQVKVMCIYKSAMRKVKVMCIYKPVGHAISANNQELQEGEIFLFYNLVPSLIAGGK